MLCSVRNFLNCLKGYVAAGVDRIYHTAFVVVALLSKDSVIMDIHLVHGCPQMLR